MQPAIQQTRMAICQACKFYKEATRSCGTLLLGRKLKPEEVAQIEKELHVKQYRKKYRLCGCLLPVKTYGIFEACPIGKWGVHSLSETELQQIISFVDGLATVGTYNVDSVRQLNKWYKLLTGSRKNISTCPSCVRETVSTFRKEISKYKEQIQLQQNANNNNEVEGH